MLAKLLSSPKLNSKSANAAMLTTIAFLGVILASLAGVNIEGIIRAIQCDAAPVAAPVVESPVGAPVLPVAGPVAVPVEPVAMPSEASLPVVEQAKE